ncbi:MAG: TcpQ domain-containing protein [Alphaproteobacteria bacterium]|nr:TcpQ domain-containing protein [Alphaproteobacteria bacterium]
MAAFDYVPPVAPPTFAAARDDLALAAALTRLVPEGIDILFDRRVDATRIVAPGHAALEDLLIDTGLMARHDGGSIIFYPAGIDSDAIEAEHMSEPVLRWRVAAGEMLRTILDRWGSKGVVDIVWLTDRRWRVDENHVFTGTFSEAVAALLFALSHLPHAPAGELSGDGRSLVILHRLPGVAP